MRHKMDRLTRTVLQFAGAMIGLVIIAFFATAQAQDAIDVQQNLDIATVNSKAEDAKGRAMGVEGRLTMAEGTIANHGSQVSAIATGQVTIEQRVGAVENSVLAISSDMALASNLASVDARVALLEAAPPPSPSNQAQVDALAARVASLEAAPAPTPVRYVIRDAFGELVGQWASRSEVGQGIMALTFGDLAYTVTVDTFNWELDPRMVYYDTSVACSNHNYELAYRRTKDVHGNRIVLPESQSFTGMKDGHIQNFLGVPNFWAPDYASEFWVSAATPFYFRNQNGDCGELNLTGYFVKFKPIGPVPVFTPPFALTEE